MTFRELLEELNYLSVDVDTEVIVRDSQGNYCELVCVSEEDDRCELIAN